MVDSIHVTKNSEEAAANVSALSINDLMALVGRALPISDPLEEGALWLNDGVLTASALTPIAISDFENQDFSLGSVEKEYRDLWTDIASPVALTSAGLGLSVIGDPGIATVSASGSVTAQANLFDMLNVAVGFSAVIDVEIVGTSLAANPNVRASLEGASSSRQGIYASTNNGEFQPVGFEAFGIVKDTGGTRHTVDSLAAINPIRHRIAFTSTPASILISADGKDVVNETASTGYASLASFKISLGAYVYAATGTASAIVKKIAFYRPITDSTALKALSSS